MELLKRKTKKHSRYRVTKKINHYNGKWYYFFHKQKVNGVPGCCAISMEEYKRGVGELCQMTELHHARMPNTKINRERFPLVIHSPFNLLGVNHDRHMARRSFGRRKGDLWSVRLEEFLSKPHHWKLRMFALTGEYPNE